MSTLFGSMGNADELAANRAARNDPEARWCIPNGGGWCEVLAQPKPAVDFVSYALMNHVWTACLDRVEFSGGASLRRPTCRRCGPTRQDPGPVVRVWLTSQALEEGVCVVDVPRLVVDRASNPQGYLHLPGTLVSGYPHRLAYALLSTAPGDWFVHAVDAVDRVRQLLRRRLERARRELKAAEVAAAEFKVGGPRLAKTSDQVKRERAARRSPR